MTAPVVVLGFVLALCPPAAGDPVAPQAVVPVAEPALAFVGVSVVPMDREAVLARPEAGTDMGNPFVVAGFALHEELANLVAAGLSPYEALRAATSGAAEFMGAAGEWGVVAAGRRADLLLLEANPLDDVGNAARRVGVMVRGRWLEQAELQGQLDELAARFAPADDAAMQAATEAEPDPATERGSDAGTGAADEASPRR